MYVTNNPLFIFLGGGDIFVVGRGLGGWVFIIFCWGRVMGKCHSS